MRRGMLLLALALGMSGCGGRGVTPSELSEEIPADVTQVLYFHGKQRCITCNAIEELAHQVVDSLSNAKIILRVIDISAPENEAITDRYEVSWSSLIVDRAGNTRNLTQEGFSYATASPTLFKAKLKEAIQQLAR